MVNSKSGQPVSNLRQEDFAILDNKTPRPITSFRVMTPAQEPVEVILFIDAVNTPYQMVAYMRQYVGKFLQANEGKLAHPTAIAILTDQGVQIDSGFSTDGNALNDSLARHTIGLRTITSSSQWGGLERLQICLNAFQQLLAAVSNSPRPQNRPLGFAGLATDLRGPRVFFTAKQTQGMFSSVVSFSTQMRQDNVTLYNINPVGTGSIAGDRRLLPSLPQRRSQDQRRAVRQPRRPGARGPERRPHNRVGQRRYRQHPEVFKRSQSMVRNCFRPTTADKPNEYHQIQIKLDKPGLVARTRTGYYSNPQIHRTPALTAPCYHIPSSLFPASLTST